MALAAGSRIGSYEVTEQIGIGGMGEVWRATDTVLGRHVAIKILPDAFARDPERLARFEREARILASLNHANIATIHGLEKSPDHCALVMELVDGLTLADRINDGPIPVTEALAIATEIAEALEAAHEQGIIHRDLKPANVKVRPDGTVKVLDFGLAKALVGPAKAGHYPTAAGSPPGDRSVRLQPDLSQSPTITTPAMTQLGMILGTAAYMSPEQAKGREADKRSDVWAFGVTVFEMLTGTRAFSGDDVSDTLASVLKSEPDWMLLPADTPPALRTVLQRCVVKDRRGRVSDISTVLFVLRELNTFAVPAQNAPQGTERPRTHWRWVIPAAVATSITAIVVGTAAWALRPVPASPPVAQFSLPLPEGQFFSTTVRQAIGVSPDGTQIAYVANSRLYLRAIGDVEAHPIPGTENQAQGVSTPMFAPDGRSIAFFDLLNSSLKRISLAGGTASTIASFERGGGPMHATWGATGILIADPRPGGGILRVSPNGGVPERVITVSDDELVHGAEILPDGNTVLFSVAKNTGNDDLWDRAQVVTQSLAGGDRRVLLEGGSDARYLPTGHLLYSVGGTTYARPFNAGRLTLTGEAVPVITGVRRASLLNQSGITQFAVSNSGTLIYVPGPSNPSASVLGFVIGDGRSDLVPLKIPPAAYVQPRASRDGKWLALARNDGKSSDIHIYDLSASAPLQRLTFGGTNRFPVWYTDSRHITFQSERDGSRGIYWQPLAGGAAEPLTKPASGEEHIPEAWSPTGRHLLFSILRDSKYTLWVLTLDGRRIEAFGAPASREPLNASFSDDGKWVAYAFTEQTGGGVSPDRGVYVEPFPPAPGKRNQVPKSVVDFHPVWAPDGKNILYVPTSAAFLVSVPVTTHPTLSFGERVSLTQMPRPGLRSSELRGYDVLPDGRIVSVAYTYGDTSSAAPRGEIRLVLNWFEELKRLVPTN